ncbi:MAG: thiamine phosphate synthase [Xylophilus ampelinus]
MAERTQELGSAAEVRRLACALAAHHAPVFCDPATGGVRVDDVGDAVDRALRESVDAPRAEGRTPAWRAARAGCRALGFVPRDADCLADAWEASAARRGAFAPDRWPDAPADFGLPVRPRGGTFPAHPDRTGLYAVLPDAAWVGRMARVGVPVVQLRFKSEDAVAVAREVRAAVDAVRGTGALLYVNDHWQQALDAGAYGIHLGQEDLDALPAHAFDRMRSAGLRLGLSTHGYAEMVRAERAGPSYIALGAVYPTTLKKMETAPQGVARLGAYARLLQAVGTPQVAIGGIDARRLPEALATGAGAIAVVRALVAADSPEAEAEKLQEMCHNFWIGPDADRMNRKP